MNSKFTLLVLVLTISLISNAQDYVLDKRDKINIEYDHRMDQWEDMSKYDILQALELAGVQMHKFDLGEFDTDYKLLIFVDEYKDGKLVKTDTIKRGSNGYIHFSEDHDCFRDLFDQLKFICKIQDTVLTTQIHTYAGCMTKRFNIKKYSERSMYKLAPYGNTQWQLNKNIPLLLYASSWWDKHWEAEVLCPVPRALDPKDRDTQNLLKKSPHYLKFSYIVKEPYKRLREKAAQNNANKNE